MPICAELARLDANSASRIVADALAGHHPSATSAFRVTSTENMFSVWYVAFSLRTHAIQRSRSSPIALRAWLRRRTLASSVD